MRIAATTLKGGIDDIITPQFGRAATFTIVDYDGEAKNVEVIENRAASQASGAGIAASQTLVDKKVDVVLTGNVGPNAMNVLRAAGIKIYAAAGLKVKDAIEKYVKGELEEITSPSGGMGKGMGRGGGRGIGRGMGGGMGGGRWR